MDKSSNETDTSECVGRFFGTTHTSKLTHYRSCIGLRGDKHVSRSLFPTRKEASAQLIATITPLGIRTACPYAQQSSKPLREGIKPIGAHELMARQRQYFYACHRKLYLTPGISVTRPFTGMQLVAVVLYIHARASPEQIRISHLHAIWIAYHQFRIEHRLWQSISTKSFWQTKKQIDSRFHRRCGVLQNPSQCCTRTNCATLSLLTLNKTTHPVNARGLR